MGTPRRNKITNKNKTSILTCRSCWQPKNRLERAFHDSSAQSVATNANVPEAAGAGGGGPRPLWNWQTIDPTTQVITQARVTLKIHKPPHACFQATFPLLQIIFDRTPGTVHAALYDWARVQYAAWVLIKRTAALLMPNKRVFVIHHKYRDHYKHKCVRGILCFCFVCPGHSR